MHLILVAGGPSNSTRFGGGANKVFTEVRGRTLLGWALRSFMEGCRVSKVAVAITANDFPQAAAIAVEEGLPKGDFLLVESRESRMASIASALSALAPAGEALVAIHDSARPFPAACDIRRCIDMVLSGSDAAVLCEPFTDSIARIDGGRIVEGIPRTGMVRITTPLVSRAEKILAAREKWAGEHGESGKFPDGLEDSVLMAWAGFVVQSIPASSPNPKITYPSDLSLVDALVSGCSSITRKRQGVADDPEIQNHQDR